MRNYVWRQNHPTLTDEMAAAAAVPLEEKPQRKFEGKFRLGSRTRKKKTSTKAKRSNATEQAAVQSEEDQESSYGIISIGGRWPIRDSLMPDKILMMRHGANYDPFNAFLFPLGPESQKLIFYCEPFFHAQISQ